jgi:hypothetical protein
LSRPHSGQTRCAQQAGSPPSSCSVAGDGGTLARSSSIDAVIRSSSCVRFRPARGRITPSYRRFNGLLFLLRSAVSCKTSASHTTVSPGPRGRRPAGLASGPTAGSSPGGRDGRPPDHRAHARTPDPGGNDQPDGRGAVVVFVAHLKMPAEVQHVHYDDDSGAGLLRPAAASGRFA